MRKIILILLISSIACRLIYLNTKETKKDIMIISDSISASINQTYYDMLQNKYSKLGIINTNYIEPYLMISSINKYIENNNKRNNKHIKEIIESSEYIIIFIGNDELSIYDNTKITKTNIAQNFILEYENLVQEIRKINNKKIIIFGLIPLNKTIININKKLYKLSLKYDCEYIDSVFLINNNIHQNNKLNVDQHKMIYNKLIKEIKL